MAIQQVSKAMAREWRRYRDRNMAKGTVSVYQVCLELSRKYECDPTTVRRHLDPGYAERHKAVNRECQRRRRAALKAKREYERHYRRLTRNPGRYIEQAFAGHWEMDISTITMNICEACEGVAFRANTIERILDRYVVNQENGGPKCRDPPYLERLNLFVYRYSDGK